jgi:hypothetical protein
VSLLGVSVSVSVGIGIGRRSAGMAGRVSGDRLEFGIGVLGGPTTVIDIAARDL